MINTLDAFKKVYQQTECIFAKSANLVAPMLACPPEVNVRDYVRDFAGILFTFCDRLEDEPLDGFVFAFSAEEVGNSVEAVELLLRQVLGGIAELDADAAESLATVHLLEPEWRFKCRGHDFFISIIAPCYTAGSSRFGFGRKETFIHLQPSETFTRHRPPFRDRIPEEVRETIRRKYSNSGRPYDAEHHVGFSQALRFVSPHELSGHPIRWWE